MKRLNNPKFVGLTKDGYINTWNKINNAILWLTLLLIANRNRWLHAVRVYEQPVLSPSLKLQTL